MTVERCYIERNFEGLHIGYFFDRNEFSKAASCDTTSLVKEFAKKSSKIHVAAITAEKLSNGVWCVTTVKSRVKGSAHVLYEQLMLRGKVRPCICTMSDASRSIWKKFSEREDIESYDDVVTHEESYLNRSYTFKIDRQAPSLVQSQLIDVQLLDSVFSVVLDGFATVSMG